jgi:hypothetical protein
MEKRRLPNFARSAASIAPRSDNRLISLQNDCPWCGAARKQAEIRCGHLVGWGARTRTWEWRNQNPSSSPYLSKLIPKKCGNSTSIRSRG